MPKSPTQPKNATRQVLIKFIIKDLPSIVLSLALFLGGIWLLSLHIPGWSLLWGLIILPIGFAFMVYTLDDVARNVIVPAPFKLTKCKVCSKNTYAREDDKDVICGRCREDITKAILEKETE